MDLRPVRQGDVLLIPTNRHESNTEVAPPDPRGIVLAEGDSSAHHHGVFGDAVSLLRFTDPKRGERLLSVGEGGAELRVVGGERHSPIALAAGDYLVRLQRMWSGEDEARSRVVED